MVVGLTEYLHKIIGPYRFSVILRSRNVVIPDIHYIEIIYFPNKFPLYSNNRITNFLIQFNYKYAIDNVNLTWWTRFIRFNRYYQWVVTKELCEIIPELSNLFKENLELEMPYIYYGTLLTALAERLGLEIPVSNFAKSAKLRI